MLELTRPLLKKILPIYLLALVFMLAGFQARADLGKDPFETGITALAGGRWDIAVEYLTKAVVKGQSKAEAYYYRGWAYRELHELDKSLADLNQALAMNPMNQAAFTCRGITYTEMGDFGKAAADFKQALVMNPKDHEAYFHMGLMLKKQGDVDGALLDINRAIELVPEFAEARYQRGLIYQQKGDLEKAIQDFSQRLASNPEYEPALYQRGIAYVQKGEADKAIRDFDIVLKNSADDLLKIYISTAFRHWDRVLPGFRHEAEIHYWRGLAYGKTNNLNQALADFILAFQLQASSLLVRKKSDSQISAVPDTIWETAESKAILAVLCNWVDEKIKKDPSDAMAYYHRGLIRALQAAYAQAQTDCSRALELDPALAPAYFCRGWIFFQQGLEDKALADMNTVQSLEKKRIEKEMSQPEAQRQ